MNEKEKPRKCKKVRHYSIYLMIAMDEEILVIIESELMDIFKAKSKQWRNRKTMIYNEKLEIFKIVRQHMKIYLIIFHGLYSN